VALGDAYMRLNPTLGQGMAKVMVEVTTLDSVLRGSVASHHGLAVGPSFFKKLAARTSDVWTQNKIGDYAHELCEPAIGETRDVGSSRRTFNAYIGKRALQGDVDMQRRMAGVRGWVLPPTDMLAPGVLAKVLVDWMQRS
jgi:hypothetical protein